MSLDSSIPPPSQLASILITHELPIRRCRAPDLKRENEAFRELALDLATNPDRVLDRLVELTIELCDADTAGISLEETDDSGQPIFRWVAVAGDLKQMAGGTTPRHFSPCGVCLDLQQPVLMDGLDRIYPYFKSAPLPFVEALLLPWGVTGSPAGTLWAVAHSDRRKFELEDVRLMNSLAAFAAGAILARKSLVKIAQASAASRVMSQLAHQLNNPLQAALFAIYNLRNDVDLTLSSRKQARIVEAQLTRIAALSAEILED